MKYLIITFLSVLFTFHSYSQAMTPYEKKCYSLQLQFLRNLGVDEVILKKTNSLSDIEKLLVAGNFLQKLDTEKGLMLMLALGRDLKEAEKLKNTIDFQRDKAKKEEAERKKQFELAKVKERQRQYEIKKKEEDKREYFEKSDFVTIRNKIKESFIGWIQKGEFEKSEDYQIRIVSNSGIAFDSLCFKTIMQAVNDKEGFYSKLLKYNADTENYGIEFTINNLTIKDSAHIPIEDAVKFRNNFDGFQIYADYTDWLFVDNYLAPKKIIFYNSNTNEQIDFNFSNKSAKKIVFSASDLGANFSSVKNKFVFENAYLNYILENKDTSTIRRISEEINSIAWDNLMVRNYKNALFFLEKTLPIIDQKDEIYPYLLSNLAHAYLFTNDFEKAHKIYFGNNQRKLNDMSWKEAILQDFTEFKKNGIISADMEKIRQEIRGR